MQLVNGWNSFWAALVGGDPKFTIVLGALGAALVAGSLLFWAWSKRKGGGGGMSGFPTFPVIIGAACAAPTVIVPLILMLVGLVINVLVGLVKAFV